MKPDEIRETVLAGGKRVRDTLATVPGLKLACGQRGVYEHAGVRLNVVLEGSEQMTLEHPLPTPPPAAEALELASDLPGSLRLARSADGVALVADTLVDGVSHLAATLAQLASGAAWVLDGHEPGELREPTQRAQLPAARVDEAVAGLGWADDAVVREEEYWELRPRLQLGRGTGTFPVRLTRERGGLRVRRVLLRSYPAASEAALAELALQANGRMRLARLAADGGTLVAEALLRDELVTPAWLGETVRAVAVASGRCQAAVEVLITQQHVAEVFLAASATPETPLPQEARA